MSKRPEQVHYIPPGRRKPSVVSVSTPVIAPPLGPSFINSSSARITTVPANTTDSPASSHAHLVSSSHARFEPSTTPPLRTTAADPMRSQHSTPHGRIPSSQRRDSYEVGMSPGKMHHRVEVREHGGFRSTDTPFYRSDKATAAFESSPRLMSGVVSPGKYTLQQPMHLARNRSYEDRYKEIPPPFRSKAAPPPGWMDGIVGKHSPSPMIAQPVRILRNPERERERERENRGEFVEEHVTRSFNLAPRPEHQEKARPTYVPGGSNKAQYLGESIHSLAPSTSIGERVRKFISTLHPERPDPPIQDEPYEYPYTQPCDPSTLPAIKNGRNFPVPINESRSGWVPENVRIPAGGEHTYFGAPLKAKPPPQEKRRRHRVRPHRGEYDEASSQGDDCARRLYRLHT